MHLIQKVAGKHKIITVTFDRGGEFAFHHLLKFVVAYFCDPGCPNQKGLVENRIGKIRYSIESGMSFDTITQPNLDEFVRRINDEILQAVRSASQKLIRKQISFPQPRALFSPSTEADAKLPCVYTVLRCDAAFTYKIFPSPYTESTFNLQEFPRQLSSERESNL